MDERRPASCVRRAGHRAGGGRTWRVGGLAAGPVRWAAPAAADGPPAAADPTATHRSHRRERLVRPEVRRAWTRARCPACGAPRAGGRRGGTPPTLLVGGVVRCARVERRAKGAAGGRKESTRTASRPARPSRSRTRSTTPPTSAWQRPHRADRQPRGHPRRHRPPRPGARRTSGGTRAVARVARDDVDVEVRQQPAGPPAAALAAHRPASRQARQTSTSTLQLGASARTSSPAARSSMASQRAKWRAGPDRGPPGSAEHLAQRLAGSTSRGGGLASTGRAGRRSPGCRVGPEAQQAGKRGGADHRPPQPASAPSGTCAPRPGPGPTSDLLASSSRGSRRPSSASAIAATTAPVRSSGATPPAGGRAARSAASTAGARPREEVHRAPRPWS